MRKNLVLLIVLTVCLCPYYTFGSEVSLKPNNSSNDMIVQKLKTIIIPRLDTEDVTIPTAVKYLREQSRQLDSEAVGVNIFLQLAPENADEKVLLNLILTNKTLGECLFFICASAKLELRIDKNAVVISTPENPSYDITQDEVSILGGGAPIEKLATANMQTNKRLENIILPGIEFDDADIMSVIRYFSRCSERYSTDKKRICVVARFSRETAAVLPKLTMSFTKIPMSELLRYICENGCLKYSICKETIIFTVDWIQLVKLYRKAAEQGNADAQYNLGLCYAKGVGVTKDLTEAVKLFRQAAEQEDAKAQYNLGRCYARGYGINKDSAEAFKWFRKAAEQENELAQYNLGWCYIKGVGIAKDETEALKWYRKAAEQGNQDAKDALEKLKPSNP